MKTEELNYALPERLIAQHPAEQRDGSRLMVVDRESGNIALDVYENIHRYLRSGDRMVLNNTRVIRARLRGRRAAGGNVEVFLLRETAPGCWLSLVRPSAKVKTGATVYFAAGLEARLDAPLPDGRRIARFNVPEVMEHLEGAGEIPLPPYIKRNEDTASDTHRYQTIFAERPGAVAAPTAGLHLTEAVFKTLDELGVPRTFLTLHVGYGTFKPVVAENLEDHKVDPEEYEFTTEAAEALNSTRAKGGRILAVGTTCARVLESRFTEGRFTSGAGETDLYIRPPYRFQGMDLLQTNFHLPKSSLLALVCAFAGRDLVMTAYERAVREEFRFYSYGDVMLLR